MNCTRIRIEEPEVCENFATIRLYRNKCCLGHAHLSINGGIVTLADIVILNTKRQLRWFPLIKVHQNYRNKGYGTLLLNSVIMFCKSHGIQRIQGKLSGDKDRLISWYRRNGFIVTNENIITMQLSS